MRILLSGYYGFGNLGDEALLQVIVSELKTRYPSVEIDVLSAQPETTAHELRVAATARADLGAVKRAIERADVVLSGGGGLLQNATSLKSLLYYAGIVRTATRAKKTTMIFAQSIGPLDFWGKKVVRECCKDVSGATVRDERSRELLAGLLPGVRVERTADPVFLYDHDESEPAVPGLGPESEPLAIVSVRKVGNFNEGAPLIAAAVDRLAEAYGVRAAFLPLGGTADADASTVVIRKCRSSPLLLPACDLREAAGIIRRAGVVIGMRLHALILAIRFGVPFAAIPYDPKVSSLCDDLAYPLAPLWTPAKRSPSAAADAISVAERLWTQRAALAEQVRAGGVEMAALARRNFALLDELVPAGAR